MILIAISGIQRFIWIFDGKCEIISVQNLTLENVSLHYFYVIKLQSKYK